MFSLAVIEKACFDQFGSNLLGDALRDTLDPRLRGTR